MSNIRITTAFKALFYKLGLYIRVCMAALFIAAILPFNSFPRVIELLHTWQKKLNSPTYDTQDIISVVGRVSQFKLFVVRKNCLKKSLLYYFFLKKAGLTELEVVIGVNKSNGKLSGHSWLVLDNKPYLEDRNPHDEFYIIYSSSSIPQEIINE